MIRIVLVLTLAVAAWPAGAQQAVLSEMTLALLGKMADEVPPTETGTAPDILLRATIAANEPRHMTRPPARSALTRQLAHMNLVELGAMRTLERTAYADALTAMLADRLSPGRIVAIYAATVYYGRNCYGYAAASTGLARKTVDEADDAVWLALAALPRSPTWYLRDRVALKDRVEMIIEEMEAASLISEESARRLDALPIASVDVGRGCPN